MSDCTQLSDRMPVVARGTARWTPIEEAHLASCRDCSAEWDLVRRTAVIGRSIEIRDPEGLAGGVLAALRASTRPAPAPAPVRALRWIVPAAIAAGLLFAFLPRPDGEAPADPAALTLTLLPEAESLTDAELESVIRAMPPADKADRANPTDSADTDSLTDEQLNRMLEDMEG